MKLARRNHSANKLTDLEFEILDRLPGETPSFVSVRELQADIRATGQRRQKGLKRNEVPWHLRALIEKGFVLTQTKKLNNNMLKLVVTAAGRQQQDEYLVRAASVDTHQPVSQHLRSI
jgi:hypothetical protein